MVVIGYMIDLMAWVIIILLMGINIKEKLRMDRKMDMVSINMLMAINMMASGKMIRNMEKVSIFIMTKKRNRSMMDNGKKGIKME